jgi:hypothetical protein
MSGITSYITRDGTGMESFVIRRRTWAVLRLFSHDPLVRTSDRIEAAVVTLAALVVVIAAACAGALGTMVHDARAQMYIEQAKTRHPVVAIAVEDSKKTITPEAAPGTTGSRVYARWQANGTDHAGVIRWDEDVKAGDRLQIWVDADGNRVNQPSPASRAITDAVSVAIVAWLSVVLAVTGVVNAVRAHTSATRDAQWEREIRCLLGGEGCANSPQ